ncbi:MAG: hypothetical protein NT027_01675 [Proteobacteria bacterium]|nr:hypothetical protein [Pseudomonadota bacterium]
MLRSWGPLSLIVLMAIGCRPVGKNLSSLQGFSPPEEEAGSATAYSTWVRERLYANKQYHGQSDIKSEGIAYSGDQYTIRIPKGQMTNDDAKQVIEKLQNRPSEVYGPVTGKTCWAGLIKPKENQSPRVKRWGFNLTYQGLRRHLL